MATSAVGEPRIYFLINSYMCNWLVTRNHCLQEKFCLLHFKSAQRGY